MNCEWPANPYGCRCFKLRAIVQKMKGCADKQWQIDFVEELYEEQKSECKAALQRHTPGEGKPLC